MSTATLDSVIISQYAEFGVPADQIVAVPDLASQFLARVNEHLPAESHIDQATCNKRLLNLRRRGESKGGLPRLERAYNGRIPNKPR